MKEVAETYVIGEKMDIEKFMDIVRKKVPVTFSEACRDRVNKSRKVVEQFIEDGKVMYGITTGFGSLCTKVINKEETAQLQKNIVLSHSTSVGDPMSEEEVRATLLMILQNLSQGYSGVRMVVLERYGEFLNKNLIPYAPKDGSVGYLSPEAHMALVLIGEGQAYYNGKLMPGAEALAAAGIQPLELSSKEGLALVSGTTSVTGLGAIALYDMIKAAKTADIIAAFTLESSKGIIKAFDPRVMSVRPHEAQGDTAANVRNILKDSQVIEYYKDSRVQDALSLRCVPQLHGAAKKSLYDALRTIEIEMNSCCDNPIIWPDDVNPEVISACNADSAYVGIEMDSACIAATSLAKMSERRNNRMIDESLGGYPSFLIRNPGLNSGLMIPQYTQAGLLNEMRILSTSSTIDNTSTCGNQEDYVAMGYNASKKAIDISKKLEYILAIELLSAFETQGFIREELKRSSVTLKVFEEIGKTVPLMTEDIFLHPHIEHLKDMIHSGQILDMVEEEIGQLK
ncbi:MAG TPA: aromatic amino acid lyase [Candidatus Pelethocola excrementipullorum]|nr:aromatic amino acid lyase [Candidatus Pelethocola excrementipullorum]